MIGRGRVRRLPEPRGPGGGRGARGRCLRPGRGFGGRLVPLLGGRAGRRVRDICRGSLRPDCRPPELPDIRRHPDAIGGPVQRLASAEAARARNEVDQPAAGSGLVVEPHAGLAPAMTTARLPLRPQRHSWPAPRRACPEARPRSREPGREARHRRPASRARSSRPPRNGHAHARRPEGRDGWARGVAGAGGQGGWGTGFEGCFPPILPPLRGVPRRRSGSARKSGARPTRADPARQDIDIRSFIGWRPTASEHHSADGRRGGSERGFNPLPGESAQRFNCRDTIVARGQPVGLENLRSGHDHRASFPAETVHGRSPKVRSKNGRPFRACRRCGSIPARSLRWPRSRLERGPTSPGLG